MPWNEVTIMNQRTEFIESFVKKELSFSKLCRQFKISRKTGYKLVSRYKRDGIKGLESLSKAPHNKSNAFSEEMTDLIIAIKSEWGDWGPKKILAHLQKKYDLEKYPSKTTVGNILKRNGLVKPRKKRKRYATRTEPLADCNQSNTVWCIDFKGWRITADGKKVGPFTIMDGWSRFLIACVQLDFNNTEHVWAIFEKCFYEYGLPERIRSDNGPPFATNGPGRLSELAIKLIKVGVIPEWIEPGHPEQNGRHERMHLTLEREGIFSHLTMEKQKEKLIKFINYYNYERPHEALKQNYPGEMYIKSKKQWDGKLRPPEYEKAYIVRKVQSSGKMRVHGREIYISRVFDGEAVGVYEEQNGLTVYYGPIKLGIVNEKENRLDFERIKSRKKKIGGQPPNPREKRSAAASALC